MPQPLPKHPFTVSGGCNCGAYRYQVSVPAWDARAENPYRTPGSVVDGDPRIPMVAIDHCNDCRRATGALLPVWFITDIQWVGTTCSMKDGRMGNEVGKSNGSGVGNGAGVLEMPASKLFDFENIDAIGTYVSVYKSSQGRSRWFCSRCGTQLAYTVDPGAIPKDWGWPRMLDICLGTIDRVDLEKDYMRPERQLWCEKGIPWLREMARDGAGGIPEHPLTKMDKEIDQSRGIEQVLEEAKSSLQRVTPAEAMAEMRNQVSGSPSVVLVDIRPAAQRQAEGMIEEAIVVERNVLEWRFDLRSNARLPIAGRYDLRVIVFCQEGYTSSLAAHALQQLGLKKATDMAGGIQAWKDAGLPVKV